MSASRQTRPSKPAPSWCVEKRRRGASEARTRQRPSAPAGRRNAEQKDASSVQETKPTGASTRERLLFARPKTRRLCYPGGTFPTPLPSSALACRPPRPASARRRSSPPPPRRRILAQGTLREGGRELASKDKRDIWMKVRDEARRRACSAVKGRQGGGAETWDGRATKHARRKKKQGREGKKRRMRGGERGVRPSRSETRVSPARGKSRPCGGAHWALARQPPATAQRALSPRRASDQVPLLAMCRVVQWLVENARKQGERDARDAPYGKSAAGGKEATASTSALEHEP